MNLQLYIIIFFIAQSLAGNQCQGFSRHKIYSNSSLAYDSFNRHFSSASKKYDMNRTVDNATLNREFNALLESLARSKGVRDVFVDLIDLALFPLIVSDHGNLARDPRSNYSPDEVSKLVKLISILGESMDDYNDGLGDFFMEYLSFGKNGQFFTPQPICDMMASMTVANNDNKPGMSVCDCACGSGRTLLAAAKVFRDFTFVGSDIDLTCVKMCTLNLAYNSLVGEVAWMNTLSLEHYGSFHIHVEPLTKLPYIITTPANTSRQLPAIIKVAKAMPEHQRQQVIQQTLF